MDVQKLLSAVQSAARVGMLPAADREQMKSFTESFGSLATMNEDDDDNNGVDDDDDDDDDAGDDAGACSVQSLSLIHI